MSDLTSMKNIGKEMEQKLMSIGVNSTEELKKLGSEDAFFLLKAHYPNICLVHLYALQGAIDDVPYNYLSEKTKLKLVKFSEKLK